MRFFASPGMVKSDLEDLFQEYWIRIIVPVRPIGCPSPSCPGSMPLRATQSSMRTGAGADGNREKF